ncbi:glutamate--cysteine ligase [Arthrobacter sp. zg-Y844]|uniref:carboxylate-amine ligase n=1 Tax=Arthrobacter sp. zg-Y844 TaxID=2964612 RepID=UPI002102C4BC|nr:glutamate--cysteine ligase [Arthrobacter sp. zg-Y844]MCQ1985303.1 glutamate--cysteine ligase [Arthrobacter sp. zg-Y844]
MRMVFTFGIEEEFLLMDASTGFPTGAQELTRALISPEHGVFSSSAELLDAQVESSTRVCTTREEALDALLGFRSRLAEAAASAGVRVAPTGAAPRIQEGPPVLNSSDRYQRMGILTGAVAHEQYVNGTHIHVGIPSRDTGVRVLNGLRPWLALLGAVAANSPYWRGQDSSFASWRMVHYRRWSVQGCPPLFADAQDYTRRLESLLATDVVLDAGHVGWAARLSDTFPTVEVRIADAQLQARDSLLLATLVRALVATLASAIPAVPAAVPDPELLDVGLWQAARFGMSGNLVSHPGGSLPAADHLSALLEYVAPALEEAGDREYAVAGVARVLAGGTGAERQRTAFRSGGYAGLADLYTRSLSAE